MSAHWDTESNKLFLELCVEEVRKVKKSSKSLNIAAWDNIRKKFHEITEKEYTQKQFRNHWDALKNDWRLYQTIKRMAFGVGWKEASGTISASEPWWSDKIQHCIGAIDGTHVEVVLSPNMRYPFYGRKGYPTQNVMAACNFDMCFTYCVAGWEGSAHDTHIFLDTIHDETKKFKMPVGDQFYLVDSGYPNMKGFLAPYKNERYHLQDYKNQVPQSPKELFNYCHSSLRSVIERTFGVWKNRFQIMKRMRCGYNWDTQVKLVSATMALHNYIRHQNLDDIFFEEAVVERDNGIGTESTSIGSTSTNSRQGEMDRVRDGMCNDIWQRKEFIL